MCTQRKIGTHSLSVPLLWISHNVRAIHLTASLGTATSADGAAAAHFCSDEHSSLCEGQSLFWQLCKYTG